MLNKNTAGWVGLAVFALGACAPTYHHDPGLDLELARRSRDEGLGVLTTAPTMRTMPVLYFDNTYAQVHCCGVLRSSWVIPGGRQLLTLDGSRYVFHPMNLASWGANVSIFDLKGVEQRRLNLWIRASYVAMSPDGLMIAFRGQGGQSPAGGVWPQRGLLIGSIGSTTFQKIDSIPEEGDPAAIGDKRAETMAWSPNGDELAYGKDGSIQVYNLLL